MHKSMEQVYVSRLRRCTTEQLMALQAYLRSTGNRRCCKAMLALVTSVLMARVGLSPA